MAQTGQSDSLAEQLTVVMELVVALSTTVEAMAGVLKALVDAAPPSDALQDALTRFRALHDQASAMADSATARALS